MKKIYSILAAALLTTGALLTTACSGDDDAVIDNTTLRQDSETAPTTGTETIQFTATLAAKGDNGDGTRAITTGTEDGKEILNVAWAAGEEVAIYYQKSDDTYMPLQKVREGARVEVIDSLLSEEAVMAFEYGEATTSPDQLSPCSPVVPSRALSLPVAASKSCPSMPASSMPRLLAQMQRSFTSKK